MSKALSLGAECECDCWILPFSLGRDYTLQLELGGTRTPYIPHHRHIKWSCSPTPLKKRAQAKPEYWKRTYWRGTKWLPCSPICSSFDYSSSYKEIMFKADTIPGLKFVWNVI